MKLTLKNYKIKKIKLLIKEKNLLIFCNFINNNTKEFEKLKQKMLKKNLNFFKINSSLMCYLLKNSIYLNLKNLNVGSIMILHFNLLKLFNKLLFDSNYNKLYFFCCVFNRKLYTLKLFLYLNTLKFVLNIELLYFYLKNYISVTFLSSFFLLNKKLSRNNVI
jgi:hypothetical protein